MFSPYPVTKNRLIEKTGYTEGELRARHSKWKALGLYWRDPGGKPMYDLRGIQRWARSSNPVSPILVDVAALDLNSRAVRTPRRSRTSATSNRLT